MVTFPEKLFPHGDIVITDEAVSEVTPDEAADALLRHLSGDWGDWDEHCWKVNDSALERGGPLTSRYVTSRGTRFWIITEPDRSVTTVFLPGETPVLKQV